MLSIQNVYLNGGKVLKANDTVHIIMVSHSNFMKAHHSCGKAEKRKPLNNEPWLEEYKFNTVNGALYETGKDCSIIDKAVLPAPPKLICAATVDRCMEGFKRTPDFFATRKGCEKNQVCPAA